MVVVGMGMPSFSATVTDEQYAYLIQTQGDDQSKSERLREIINKGIGVEKDE